MMRKVSGFTLVELLIALAILGTIIAVASSGIVNGLQVQVLNEATTSNQAKLRRINEVVTQEVRSAVLGGITDYPFTSTTNSVSFLLLDGGAGFQVINIDGSADTIQLAVASAPSSLEGEQVLIVNGTDGQATVFTVDDVSNSSPFTLSYSGCDRIDTMGSGSNLNMLAFKVRTVGFRYNSRTRNVEYREGDGDIVDLAFDLERFDVDYSYQDLGMRGSPRPTGDPSQQLTRLQFNVASKVPTRGDRAVERRYSSLVDLTNLNQQFRIQGVQVCE